MANIYSISVRPEIAAVQTVVDAIRAVDVPGIDANIAALDLPTNEEMAYADLIGQPRLNDHFLEVANGAAPDASIWTLTIDNDGSLVTDLSTLGQQSCKVKAGSAAANDAIMETINTKQWNLKSLGAKVLKQKFTIYCGDQTGEFGAGLLYFSQTGEANFMDGNTQHATIHCDNDVVSASSGDGGASEQTDITADFPQAGRNECEIIIDPGVSVKYYVAGALLATHTVRVPQYTLRFVVCAKNTNGIQTELYIVGANVWPQLP